MRASNVVLVHGLYADGSSWAAVIRRLQDAGLNVTSVQNPLTTLADGVAETRRVLAEQHGPTVLAGHSWSGTLVSEVGADDNISALAFIAARAPDAGEDFGALAAQFPTPPASAGVVTELGYSRLRRSTFLRDFAGDVPRDRALELFAAQMRNKSTLTSERTTVAAWRTRPSWYAVSTDDRTINPDLQRFLAARMRASTVTLTSSHLSIVSHPDAVTRVILAAAGRTR